MSDLFTLSVSEAREHPNYRALRRSPFHDAARTLISELYQRMGDPNGGFRGDFQSDGFHARLFELASLAYLEEAGALVDRSHDTPDFLAELRGHELAIEVTTANPAAGEDRDISITQLEPISDEEIYERASTTFPHRIISIIRKKLGKRYHQLPHCQGRSLVFIIAPYFEPGSVCYIDESLLGQLYGYWTPGLPEPPNTPIFASPICADLAAIVYCNQFTVPRFLRIALLSGYGGLLRGERTGFCFLDNGSDDFVVTEYRHRLDDPSVPRETWSQGVTVFYNPYAAHPIPGGLLPCSSYFHVVDCGLRREIEAFHPVTSFMEVHVDNAAQIETVEVET